MIKNQQTFSIRETAEILVPDRLGRTSYFLVLIMIVTMTLIISLILGRLPATIPIYFTLPWGEARLAPRLILFLLPGISFLFLIINLGLGRVATKLSPILPKVLAISTTVVTGMVVIALLGIVQSLIL